MQTDFARKPLQHIEVNMLSSKSGRITLIIGLYVLFIELLKGVIN